jgi:hypothetical protein
MRRDASFEHLHNVHTRTMAQVHKAVSALKTSFVQAVIFIEFGTAPCGDIFCYTSFLSTSNSERRTGVINSEIIRIVGPVMCVDFGTS